MSDDDRYISDNESDFSDYDDDYIGGVEGEDDGDVELLVTPADPNEGVDEESDIEYDASDDDTKVDDDDDSPPKDPDEIEEYEDEEEIDIKQVSNYNKEIIVVKPENRRTSHIISKYEMTEIVSIRATQISQHNNCMVDISDLDDPIKMAKRELMMRKTPLVLRRHVGDLRDKDGNVQSYYEFWDPNEMAFATVYPDVI